MPKSNFLSLLKGGDRRSIGRSDQVAEMVLKNPKLFPDLISGLWHNDPLVRIRAADATEKITRKTPALLAPHKKELLGLMAEATEPELRWHLAAMAPRLPLSAKERQLTSSILTSYLQDRSSIVKTFALQGLADMAHADPALRLRVIEILQQAGRNGTPAMKARSRKLIKDFADQNLATTETSVPDRGRPRVAPPRRDSVCAAFAHTPSRKCGV